MTGRSGRRAAKSDWMEVEQRRGISVSSTALRFEHDDVVFNLLDTPGHKDFSEDTLRVLAAVDCAVILIDAARGVEAQTEQLFQVARARGIPLLAFVNKYDRPGLEPLEMLDHLSETLGLSLVPLTWPVGLPGAFSGVIDRRDDSFHRFERVTGGAAIAPEQIVTARGANPEEDAAWAVAEEELALVDEVGGGFDAEAFARGECVPLLFGSAAWNFGVGLLLDAIRDLAPSALPRATDDGSLRPVDAPFSALAFKVQANMDRRHRDRVAFVRVCSGRFERGMRVTNARTGRVPRAQPRARGLRPGSRGARRGLPGRRRRRRLRRRRARRRHAVRRLRGALPPDPDADAGVVRGDLQPRLRPLQAVPPRARAARPGGRRARAAPRPGSRARAGRRRADAVRGRRRAPADRVRGRRAHPGAALAGRAADRRGRRDEGARRPGRDRRLRARRRHAARRLPEPLRARALRPAQPERAPRAADRRRRAGC